MKAIEKINLLKDTHITEWLETRQQVEDELSSKQTMFCVCGKLATGLHERNCKKLNNRIDDETCKRLSHLLTVSGPY